MSGSITPASCYRRRPGMMGRELPDGFVVYDPANERVHVLNDSARFVWERCDGKATAADAVAEVVAGGVPAHEAAEGVYAALKRFVAEGLVDAA